MRRDGLVKMMPLFLLISIQKELATVKKYRRIYSCPSVVDDLKGIPTFDKEIKNKRFHINVKPLIYYGAPRRIRTFAPGSGDRCSIP